MGYYTGESGKRYFERFGVVDREIYARDFRAKFLTALESSIPALTFNPRAVSIFEYGCGSGRNLSAIADLAARTAGYDLNEHAREATRSASIEVFNDLETIPRASWDLVLCHHVLEHVANPIETLALLRSLVKESGRLLLVVPIDRDRAVRPSIDGSLASRKGWAPSLARLISGSRVDSDHHLFTWTPTTMRNLLDESGWRLDSARIAYAAREDLMQPLSMLGRPTYRAGVTILGHLLGRSELICTASPR